MNYPGTRGIVAMMASVPLLFAPAFNACAVDYAGPISSLSDSTPAYIADNFSGGAAWITPVAAPSNWVSMTRAFAAVGSVMKAADYGSRANESVFLRTSVGNRGVEKMDSIDIQDARFVVPSNQVKALTIWNLNGSDLVTMVMGGGTSVLRLLDSTMTGVAASSVIGRRPVELVTGTVFVYNGSTNSFIPVNDSVMEITVN